MARVALEGISKRFGDVEAVSELDLEVVDGELLVLLGPSGCGKTTALRMVAGLEDPSAGSIHIGDHDVTAVDPKDRDVAMVFQSYALYPHMSVRRNIEFPLRQRGVDAAERSARATAAAATLGLDLLLDRKPGQLSGGQRQRVALARAIVRDPKVFLMDEPLSNLDATLRLQTRGDIAALQARLGTTTLYVTHDQVEAMTLGHRIAVLHDGRLQQVAPPQELYQRPANTFVASFLGSPGMNLLPGRLSAGMLSAADTTLPLGAHVTAVEGEVVVGFRPENARLDSVGLAASVVLVEQLGAESHVIATTAQGTRLVVRQHQRDALPVIGDRVSISFDTESISLFDAETGRRLEIS